jgi:oxygen-independent coproporphyrinogen-3 oxidase
MAYKAEETPEVSLYIHIPFCTSRCDYCDFTSFTVAQSLDFMESYFKTLDLELEHWLLSYDSTIKFKTVYIGGGTPSTVAPERYAPLFRKITPRLMKDCEFTCEVNPGSIDEHFLKYFRDAGCNRISMGLQSPSNLTLCEINRNQTIEGFLKKYSLIRRFYDNVNVDFICGLPEGLEDWLTASQQIVSSLQTEHISVYILEAEKETPLSIKYENNEIILPSMQYATEVFEKFAWSLKNMGYNRYEISNFAKHGKASKHNKVYWDYGQYIGIGVSAGGHVGNMRYVNTSSLEAYLDFPNSGSCYESVEERALLSDLREMVFMGMRYREGFSKSSLFERLMDDFNEKHYRDLESFVFLLESSMYFTVKDDKIRLNDYYFIHNREAFEFFIEIFERLFYV